LQIVLPRVKGCWHQEQNKGAGLLSNCDRSAKEGLGAARAALLSGGLALQV